MCAKFRLNRLILVVVLVLVDRVVAGPLLLFRRLLIDFLVLLLLAEAGEAAAANDGDEKRRRRRHGRCRRHLRHRKTGFVVKRRSFPASVPGIRLGNFPACPGFGPLLGLLFFRIRKRFEANDVRGVRGQVVEAVVARTGRRFVAERRHVEVFEDEQPRDVVGAERSDGDPPDQGVDVIARRSLGVTLIGHSDVPTDRDGVHLRDDADVGCSDRTFDRLSDNQTFRSFVFRTF